MAQNPFRDAMPEKYTDAIGADRGQYILAEWILVPPTDFTRNTGEVVTVRRIVTMHLRYRAKRGTVLPPRYVPSTHNVWQQKVDNNRWQTVGRYNDLGESFRPQEINLGTVTCPGDRGSKNRFMRAYHSVTRELGKLYEAGSIDSEVPFAVKDIPLKFDITTPKTGGMVINLIVG